MSRLLRRFLNSQSVSAFPSRSFQTTPGICSRNLVLKLNTRASLSQITSARSSQWRHGRRCFSSEWDRDKTLSNNRDSKDEEIAEEALKEYNSKVEGEAEGTTWLSDEEIEELSKGDDGLVRKLKFIQMEHELGRQEGFRMPSKINMKQWGELLEIPSRGGRKKYFEFLWRNEIKGLADKRKKILSQEQKAEEFANRPARPTVEEDIYGMVYGLMRNTYHMRLYDTSVNSFYHHRVISAMILGQPIIIDCGYDDHMTPREAKNCAAQIEYFLSNNREHDDPMDIHLCNASRNSKLISFLLKRIPVLFDAGYAINITEKSYLDLFPKRDLIYLSPHAREDLVEYSEDDIYIIGAMVDKTDPRPYSMAKAKKEGLRIKKLPLDRYLSFGSGSGKSLTINQMGNIMLEIRRSRDWNSAFEFVPKRKLKRGDEDEGYSRRERQSEVLSDFELMSKRKGFKNFSPNRVPSRSPNLRTIMSDN